jgi:uncharacterized protein (TIGR03435 family)
VTDAEGVTLADLANVPLFLASGRPVTDKTGLTGRFNVHLEYAPPEDARVNGRLGTRGSTNELSLPPRRASSPMRVEALSL